VRWDEAAAGQLVMKVTVTWLDGRQEFFWCDLQAKYPAKDEPHYGIPLAGVRKWEEPQNW
jgi:hypothetical protein